MRPIALIVAMGLAACGGPDEDLAQPPPPSRPSEAPKPVPKYDDTPPPLTEDNYQIFELAEMGLSETSSYSDATKALDYRYRKGAQIIGNRMPYPSSVYLGDQLLASYVVYDPDDPKYYLRRVVVGFHDPGEGNGVPAPFAIGVRHVCREVLPLEWTKEPCPELE